MNKKCYQFLINNWSIPDFRIIDKKLIDLYKLQSNYVISKNIIIKEILKREGPVVNFRETIQVNLVV